MTDTATPSPSTLDDLLKLHSGVTKAFLRKVVGGGEATAADLAAAVQFLRLNGVFRGGSFSPDEMGVSLTEVYRSLPSFDDEDPSSPTPPLN